MGFCVKPYAYPSRKRLDESRLYMAGTRRDSPMRDTWRTEEKSRDRDHYSSRKPQPRSRSPVPRGTQPTGRQRNNRHHRLSRKREFSPETRRLPPRRPSHSPARSPRLPPARPRHHHDTSFASREQSPVRFPKRRRTRSPSPANWSDRDFGDRRRFSRSRSRDRYDSREQGPPSRRTYSPHRPSPRPSRSISRGGAPEIDTYIPERRRPNTPPRRGPRRSLTPRRSVSPPPRRRSRTPPTRKFPSRPESPHSRYTSPGAAKRGRGRDVTPEFARDRRKPYSRTPSAAGDFDQEHMDGPSALRGNHGNPNHMPRGRGRRPYNANRGSFRGSPVAGSPYSSQHGSPQSNNSYYGGRGGWESHQQRFSPPQQPSQPLRQNSGGAVQSQEEYFRSQQQQSMNHSSPNQSRRPFRGARGQFRGGQYPQGQDRRFPGPDPNETPINPRGRGAHAGSVQWVSNAKRGGSGNQIGTGANAIRTSPDLSQKKPHRDAADHTEPLPPQTPTGPAADDISRQDSRTNHQRHEESLSQKDAMKFSFAFKSKPPPQSPAKPPPDLTSKARLPPTRPASDRVQDDRPPYDRPPPTQPKANRMQERRNQNHGPQLGRRDEHEGSGRTPNRPQQQLGRLKETPTEPRQRSRSPVDTNLKSAIRPRPKMTPEMAASDSIYYRKPGNESVVGAGTYGKVFKAVHIYTKDEAALKKIRMEGERDGFPITAVREIKLLQNLRHKHVVALQEVMVEKNECFMVFEYMAHDLTGLINHPTFKLAAAHKKDLGRQMFEGLEFLHRRGVMHRDIKAANLLISSDGQLKYADFGLARFYTKSRKLDYTNRVITIWYRPPELLLGETQYGPAVDIWSAACVFMEMFTRKAIFPGEGGELSQLEKIYNVLGIPNAKDWPGIVDLPWYELMQPAVTTSQASVAKEKQEKDTKFGQRVFETNYSSLLSPAALDLVTQIFSYDPATRPSAAELLEHPYFTSEEPAPQQPYELAEVAGEWHELESKQHRKDAERKEREKRREEVAKIEREKRKAADSGGRENSKKMKLKGNGDEESDTLARIDEAPAAPLPAGEEEQEDEGLSDPEGSARMSMS